MESKPNFKLKASTLKKIKLDACIRCLYCLYFAQGVCQDSLEDTCKSQS